MWSTPLRTEGQEKVQKMKNGGQKETGKKDV